LRKYHLLGLGEQAAKVIKGLYFYKHDNLAFKLRMLWDRAIDLNNWYFYGYDQHELLKLYRDPKLAVIPSIFPDGLVTQGLTRNSVSQHPALSTLPPSFADFSTRPKSTRISSTMLMKMLWSNQAEWPTC